MVEGDKLAVTDLPEPRKRQPTAVSSRESRWEITKTFLVVLFFYVLLHKALIPLVLKTTRLRTSPYAKLDFWFLHPFLLWLSMRKVKVMTNASSFLAGGGIAFAGYELMATLQGRHTGWLTFSHLLTSVPVGILCILLLSTTGNQAKASAAWLGAAGALTFLFGLLPYLEWL